MWLIVARAAMKIISLICFLGLLTTALHAQTLSIVDSDGHATTLSADQIAKLPHVSITTREHDTDAKFEGVPVSALLSTAGIQLGDAMRGPHMSEVLLIAAADNYQVAFALAEFDEAFSSRQIILADKREGKPLDAKEGPFRIVAPGDKRPARWIRQVTEMRVIIAK